MLRIDRANRTLSSLQTRSLRESGYWERRDIQTMICRSPAAFCDEIGEYIHIVGSETKPTDFVADRIDILGVDLDGTAVIIELKRESHKHQLLQALSYAGMIAKWEPVQFVAELRRFNLQWNTLQERASQTEEQAREELEDALDAYLENVNQRQRIILIAEDFDFEVLITAEWLVERYGVDIQCHRLAIARDRDEDILSISRVYPPPELSDLATRRRRQSSTGKVETGALDWTEVLSRVRNEALRKFLQEEVDSGTSGNPARRTIRFFIDDRFRFKLSFTSDRARVWQNGRFDGDVAFWKARLGAGVELDPMLGGERLRFYVSTSADLLAFRAALGDLAGVSFHGGGEEPDDSAPPERGEPSSHLGGGVGGP